MDTNFKWTPAFVRDRGSQPEGHDPQEDAGGSQRWRQMTELSSELRSEGADEMNLGWLWFCLWSAHTVFFMFDPKKKKTFGAETR